MDASDGPGRDERLQRELSLAHRRLEVAHQELQSMVDELQVSNAALRERQDEVERLNRLMGAVLGSMDSGVALVDGDLRVLVWSSRAEDLWGVRADEVVGEHLMDLDLGLPLEKLRRPLRAQLAEPGAQPHEQEMEAVDRSGRRVQVRVRISRLEDHIHAAPCAMVVMDDLTSGPSGPQEVALGDVSVVDLFVILVENHHYDVREAVRLLTLGMLAAGYPADNESVAASDAMDILEGILGSAH